MKNIEDSLFKLVYIGEEIISKNSRARERDQTILKTLLGLENILDVGRVLICEPNQESLEKINIGINNIRSEISKIAESVDKNELESLIKQQSIRLRYLLRL